MNRKDALAELIAKVEAGEGADAVGYYAARVFNPGYAHAINAYRGSLDAAKALHDAVLPGWHWTIWETAARVDADQEFTEMNDNPARAWLLAILRALHAQEAAK
jgi:hypothetical protein